jgi:hypothetical protein
MHKRLRGKKHSTGGHNTTVVDARAGHTYTWTPHHSLYKKTPLFTQEGPMEVTRLMAELTPLLLGKAQEDGDKMKQYFYRETVSRHRQPF